jgi:hypothetical protein
MSLFHLGASRNAPIWFIHWLSGKSGFLRDFLRVGLARVGRPIIHGTIQGLPADGSVCFGELDWHRNCIPTLTNQVF